jgi:hypothetical protein
VKVASGLEGDPDVVTDLDVSFPNLVDGSALSSEDIADHAETRLIGQFDDRHNERGEVLVGGQERRVRHREGPDRADARHGHPRAAK